MCLKNLLKVPPWEVRKEFGFLLSWYQTNILLFYSADINSRTHRHLRSSVIQILNVPLFPVMRTEPVVSLPVLLREVW